MAIKALIFDMDDLMIDGHKMHISIMEKILVKYGVALHQGPKALTKVEEAQTFGHKIIKIFEFLVKRYHLKTLITADALNEEFNKLLLSTLFQNVEAMPGLDVLIERLRKTSYAFAIASSATRVKINIVLKVLGLLNFFQVIVSGDEVRHGKPSPDIFLKAAEKLNVDPSQCIVFEDATNGIEAAKAAGMYCIGVHNPYTYERLGIRQNLYKADREVYRLNDITLDMIKTVNGEGAQRVVGVV